MSALFASDFQARPYWWEFLAPDAESRTPLPRHADVVIVGGGYTGLSCALQTARAGRSTVIIDAESPGWGCSTRNGGQVGTRLKASLPTLAKRYGEERALSLFQEGLNAFGYLEEFISAEGLQCDWETCGRFLAAHSEAAFNAAVSYEKSLPASVRERHFVVPKSEQRTEIGSDRYHGGIVYEDHAALNPVKYHGELLRKVVEAGATLVSNTRVTSVERSGKQFVVKAGGETILAKDVVIATNGYTGGATSYLQRRVIPIGSYMIATEDLGLDAAKEIIPNARVVSNTRKLVFYYRLSPDRRRVLFGGRVALAESDPRVTGPRLHDELTLLFPQLKRAQISHSWHGFVAYTFDHLPHLGRAPDGLHYAMGYCGSGIGMATYCGMRIGQQVLGRSDGITPLSETSFQTRPLYYGKPWFLAPAIAWYRIQDRLSFMQ